MVFDYFFLGIKYFSTKNKIKCIFVKCVTLSIDFFCPDNEDKKCIQKIFFSEIFSIWISWFIYQNSLCRIKISLFSKVNYLNEKKTSKTMDNFFTCLRIIKILNNNILISELKVLFLYKYKILTKRLFYDLNFKKLSTEAKNKTIKKTIKKCIYNSVFNLKLNYILFYFY